MAEKIAPKDALLYEFGPFRLDVIERRLYSNDGVVPLPRKVFGLLLILVEAAGHLKTREELIEALWPKLVVEEHSLTSRMSALRKALGDEGEVPRYIETVRGHGYRFIAPVEIEETVQAQPEKSTAPRQEETVAEERKPFRTSAKWPRVVACILAAMIITAGVLIWRFALHGPPKGIGPASASSIAVLPFENLSTDKANAYFASGIQDTILTKLAGIGDLRVISRTSTEQYPSHPFDLKKVAAELGVGTVLEGSVQKAGNRVLINVQLINARTDDHIWAESYTRTLENVFEVENDVATQVTAALKAKLLPAEAVRLVRTPTRDPEAYLFFLKANYFADQLSSKNSAKDPAIAATQAIALYRQAITRDPHFALAYARLSYLESYIYWYELDPTSQRIDAAKQAAKRALTLNPGLPEAHLAMGYADYYGRRNYAGALSEFKRARQGLPNNADVIAAIAYIHRRQGKWQEALTDLRQAAALDPRNPRWPTDIALIFMVLRRYAQAEQQFDRALAIDPHNYDAMAHRIWSLLLAGDQEGARQALTVIPRSVDPQGLISTVRFEVAWLDHEPDRALAALDNAPSSVPGPAVAGDMPKSLLQATAWALKRDGVRARQAYESARVKLQALLHNQPDNSDLLSTLGVAEAGLGQKAEAIRNGRRAIKLTPVTKDALAGPFYLATLAKIYTLTGEPNQAVKLLHQLLSMPAGRIISVPLLKLDPTWDSLRQNPRFQALLKQYANKAPLPVTAAASDGAPTVE